MKCEIDFHNGPLLVQPTMAFYDGQNSLRGFPRNRSNASLITKDYSGRSRAHLAVSTGRVSFRTSEGAIV